MRIEPLHAAVRSFQRSQGLMPDGIVGPVTWRALRAAAARAPREFRFARDEYQPQDTWMGLRPWIVPQAIGVCVRFGLEVSAGWGTHPPHAPRSDHRWGGAVDLVGPYDRLIRCNEWAEAVRADPWRAGAVFRWVGGPADDATGPEPSHGDHVHLSWFRFGPPTSVFYALGHAPMLELREGP